MKEPKIQFQIIIDSENFILTTSTNKKRIRANITGIQADQIPVIIDSIIDAGPEAIEYLKKVYEEKFL